MPVPCSEIVCVPALSEMVTLPVKVPTAVGLNVIEIVQLRPAATDVPHVSVSAKLALTALPEIESAAVPPFVSWTLLVALLAVTATEPNVCDVAESVTLCAFAPGAAMPKSRIRIENPTATRNRLFTFINASLSSGN